MEARVKHFEEGEEWRGGRCTLRSWSLRRWFMSWMAAALFLGGASGSFLSDSMANGSNL